MTPQGTIPWEVKNNFNPRTFYKNEKCSSLIVEYESIIAFMNCPCKGLCNKSFKKWLYAQYDTPGRLTLRSMILWGDFYENLVELSL